MATSGFEKSSFAITRMLALLGVIGALIGIALLALRLTGAIDGSNITLKEVEKEAASRKAHSEQGSPTTAQEPENVEIPADILPLFTGENQTLLRGWLRPLSEDQQRDFLKNMDKVLKAAKAKNQAVNESDVINAYKRLKLKRLGANGVDKYTDMATTAGYVIGIFGLSLILSVLSLVLVMLAIERNTRPAPATVTPV